MNVRREDGITKTQTLPTALTILPTLPFSEAQKQLNINI